MRIFNRNKDSASQHTYHPKRTNNKAFAFTLAEVLITLGIIGVVAAITIPTLIQNSRKQETVTRLQKSYSTIVSAAKMSEIENGTMISWDSPTIDWDATQSIAWWNKYFLPYSNLSLIKECTSVLGNTSECWASNATYLDGVAMDSGGIYITWVLKDGSSIAFTGITSGGGQIYVDTNGLKKPNIVGKDIFYIWFAYKNGKVVFGGNGAPRAYYLEDHHYLCNKQPGAYKGVDCGALIQQDGWQIKDDYPW